MKKTLGAVALLLCFTTAPAVADESTDVLLETIARLQDDVADLDDKVEHKNDLLACERGNRRELMRALRDGDRVVTLAHCR